MLFRSEQGALDVVVQLVPRHRDEVGGVRDVEQAVVEIGAVRRVLERSLWSIHRWVECSMWMASPLPLLAGTFEIFRFRTMTLLTFFMLRPQPVRPELEPTPMIVLFDATLTSLEQVKLPLIRTVC